LTLAKNLQIKVKLEQEYVQQHRILNKSITIDDAEEIADYFNYSELVKKK
jgi:hypothetical protein